MKRQAIAIAALAVLIHANPARADIITAGVNQAQRCIHTVLLSSLQGGLYDREPLVKLAASVCEPDLMALLLHFQPAADKAKIHSDVRIEAFRQLDVMISNGDHPADAAGW
jgi:hypothetical protein